MSNVPYAREVIDEIAVELARRGETDLAQRLAAVRLELYRRPYARGRAPRTSTPMDEALAEQLRACALRHPELSQQRIAELFRVDAGRVSEALHGDR